VILPDTGRNYLSKLYSDTWMLQHGMAERPEVVHVGRVLGTKHTEVPPLVTVAAHDKVRQAVDVLHEHGISQAPVVREAGSDEVAQFVGSIREAALLDRLFRDPDALQADVAEVMGPPIPLVEHDQPIDLAFEALQTAPAVLLVRAGRVLGVVTRSDLLEFLAHQRTG
jgi:cystathionine beta-synthase